MLLLQLLNLRLIKVKATSSAEGCPKDNLEASEVGSCNSLRSTSLEDLMDSLTTEITRPGPSNRWSVNLLSLHLLVSVGIDSSALSSTT